MRAEPRSAREAGSGVDTTDVVIAIESEQLGGAVGSPGGGCWQLWVRVAGAVAPVMKKLLESMLRVPLNWVVIDPEVVAPVGEIAPTSCAEVNVNVKRWVGPPADELTVIVTFAAGPLTVMLVVPEVLGGVTVSTQIPRG
jgi:hypothetical protein